MSNKAFKKKQKEREAAHLLMVDFVKKNAEVVATALEPIVGLWNDVNYASLKDDVGVVSQVFAGVALELIDRNSGLDPDDVDNMILPVGAKTMSSTIQDLSRFIDTTRWLFNLLINNNQDDPAIKMVQQAFFEYEAHY